MLHEHLAVKQICSSWIAHNLTKPCFENVSSGMEKFYDIWFERTHKTKCLRDAGHDARTRED